MPAKPRLAHIVLSTNRLAEMKAWYGRVLGAHVVHENPAMCFMTFDEEHHRLALVSPPGVQFTERTAITTGLQHSAYTFPALADLLEHYTGLAADGIEPLTPVQHGVTTSLYYRDPDGNLVELQVDNFASAAAASAYMEGPEFAADPVGPAFDPRAMADALAAGTPAAELCTRRWALAGPPQPDPLRALMTGQRG